MESSISAGGLEGLPEDVMRVVLSHVASPWVVQARVVCKQWKRILSCSHFARQWAARAHSISPQDSLCLMLNHREGDGDDSLSALHLPTLLCLPALLPPRSLPLAASPLGVLLLVGPSSLSLFQPLTRTASPLPFPRLIHTPRFAALTSASTSTCHFYLLAIGTAALSPAPFVAELYSSATSSWAPLPSLPALRYTAHIPRRTASLVWWKEAFYMLWGSRIVTFKPWQETTEVVATDCWGSIELPKEPRIWDARFLTLHVIKDGLFVEGNFQEQGDFQRRYPLRIGAMELEDPAKQTWKEASFMPDSLTRRLCGRQQQPAHCFYTAYSDPLSDQICFTPFFQPAVDDEPPMAEVVLLDVSSGSWSGLSNVPAGAALFSSPTFKGLTFHASC
ncbi:hypothetical protein L7F22_032080 [Adiantum nelumboides]|nr:hypothetical protein [Adiantum nelumboides]